jgi:hypothetical protein
MAKDKTTANTSEILLLLAKAKAIAERGAILKQQADALEKKIALARGTEDVTAIARKVARRPTEYFVGDEGPTPELYAAVDRMLRTRRMTFQELLDATGARANRIKGVLMRLQRDEVPLMNLGDERRAIWFIPDQGSMQRLARRRAR